MEKTKISVQEYSKKQEEYKTGLGWSFALVGLAVGSLIEKLH